MNILLACEESQAVCIEMRKRGHSAFSCDILPCSGGHPEWHIQGDVLEQLGKDWDMLIGFPPCTHLSGVGANQWPQKQKDGRQQKAFEFVLKLWRSCETVCIENPQGWLNTNWQKPTQTIHPYYFGDPYLKRTCLWMKGLSRLRHCPEDDLFTKRTHVKPVGYWVDSSANRKRRPDFSQGENNQEKRSKTFPSIARAMAEQWG